MRSLADEVPFDIPDSWEWVRMKYICQLIDGEKIQNASYHNLDARYMRGKAEPQTLNSGKYVSQGTYLILVDGENSGEVFIAPEDGYMGSTFKVLWITTQLFAPYVLKFIELYKEPLRNAKRGAAIPHLNKELFFNLPIPMPPIEEQRRIVEKIDEVSSAVSAYDIAYRKTESLNAAFPEALKKSILQEAVQGKLVPQDPSDEPAEALLERIRAEKQRLIKEGKIKKDKHESVIFRRDNSHYEKLDGIERCIDDEIPFDIPDSWAWTSVGEVCTNIQYGSSQKSSQTGKIAVLRMGNLQNGRIVLDKLVYTSDSKEIEKYPLEYNDLLFNRTNSKELVGKVAIYKSEIPAIYAGYLVRLHPVLIDSDYLNYVMQSQYYWIYCQNVRSDAIGQSNINAEKLKRFIFPLPPLQEQKRIVNQISCAMNIIKHL